MNCEQVFDFLTRGPFPSGAGNDDQVEAHLARCHECRQLAEALRPATDLLHESLPEESTRDLPGYTGTLQQQPASGLPAAVALMLEDQVPMVQPRIAYPRKSELRRASTSPWAAFLVCTLALPLLMFWGWNYTAHRLQRQGTADQELTTLPFVAQAKITAEGNRLLNALQLPTACSEPASENTTPRSRNGEPSRWTQCCTQCHASQRNQEGPASQLVSKMVASCGACHTAAIPMSPPDTPEVSLHLSHTFRLSCNL